MQSLSPVIHFRRAVKALEDWRSYKAFATSPRLVDLLFAMKARDAAAEVSGLEREQDRQKRLPKKLQTNLKKFFLNEC